MRNQSLEGIPNIILGLALNLPQKDVGASYYDLRGNEISSSVLIICLIIHLVAYFCIMLRRRPGKAQSSDPAPGSRQISELGSIWKRGRRQQ